MAVIRWIMLATLVVSGIKASRADESAARDTWQLQFTGNVYFDADAIRTALSLDLPSQEATGKYVSTEQYHSVLRDRITRGYLSRGFSDVEVEISAAPLTGVITASISEGKQRLCGDIRVSGLTARTCEFVVSLIKSDSNKKNPLQESQPGLHYWNLKSALSCVAPADQKYRPTVREALTAAGYPEAQFSIDCPQTDEGDNSIVQLQITVTESGTPLTVGEITCTGLEQHAPEQVIEFLKLKPGMPLTLELREDIERKLLDSGRFLMTSVTHGPYFFDPAVPLELQIQVREYDRTVPLDVEMSETQQALMKLSQWISRWEDSHDDVHFKFTGPTSQANDVVHATVPPMWQPLCDSAMGTGAPGHFCLDFFTSPTEGSLITVTVTDSEGNITLRRTVLLTKSVQGLVAWQSRKKWLHADAVSLQAMMGFEGIWAENGNDYRSRFIFNYGLKSELPKGLNTTITATPAAVMDLFHEQVKSISVQSDVQCLVMEHGELLLNNTSGAPLEWNLGTEDSRLEMRSGIGLLEKEWKRLEEETTDWPNQNQPGRAWTGLASMIVEDVRSAQLDNGDALHLCLDLLRNEAAVARFSKGLQILEERRSLFIPPDQPSRSNRTSAPIYSLAIMTAAAPPGSFPYRFATLTNQAKATGDTQLLQLHLSELLQTNQTGAINCLLAAPYLGMQETSGRIASAGLERLSTAEFERDLAPFITQPCYLREIVCSLLAWLQQSSDDDVERIVRVAAIYLKDSEEKPINVRPLLALIRSQREKTPEEVLALLPPVIWEGGLRNRVETSLQDIAESSKQSTKSWFNASSKKILNEVHEKVLEKERPDKKAPSTAEEKSAAKSKLLEDISLDEKWDLD